MQGPFGPNKTNLPTYLGGDSQCEETPYPGRSRNPVGKGQSPPLGLGHGAVAEADIENAWRDHGQRAGGDFSCGPFPSNRSSASAHLLVVLRGQAFRTGGQHSRRSAESGSTQWRALRSVRSRVLSPAVRQPRRHHASPPTTSTLSPAPRSRRGLAGPAVCWSTWSRPSGIAPLNGHALSTSCARRRCA